MYKLTLLLVFTSSVLFTVSGQDLTAFEKRSFTSSDNYVLPYRILYPKDYDRNREYPIVLFLHGAGERGDNNESQLVHGAKLFLDAENRKKFPAIVLFPQCAAEQYWASVFVDRTKTPFTLEFDYSKPITAPLKAAIELVKKVIDDETIDQSRIYITGLSMGGMGTFEAVYRYPNLFAAAVPICGGADLNAYDTRVSKNIFRVFHGADDALVNVSHSRKIVEKLKLLNTSVEYIEYPGVNHNSWDNAFAESDFLSWIFSKRLGG